MKITVPISVGELIDKITILEIKSLYTDNIYVKKELDELLKIKNRINQYILNYENELKKVNKTLWEIENKIRQHEREKNFDEEFIELARNTYIENDKRAEIKRKINELCNSTFKEIKIY